MLAFPRSTCGDAAGGTNRRGGGAFSALLGPGRRPAPRGAQDCGRRRRGAALVEGSIVLSLFFLFVLAMIEFARMGMANQLLTQAARAGARVAVIPRSDPTTDVTNTVNSLLNSGGISTYTLDPLPPINATASPMGTPITVTVSTQYSNISWLATPLFLGSVPLSASATLSSEYP